MNETVGHSIVDSSMSGRGLRKRLAASNSSPHLTSTPQKRGDRGRDDESSEGEMPPKRRRIRKRDALAEDEAPPDKDFYDDILKIVSSKPSPKAAAPSASKKKKASKKPSPVPVSSPIEKSPVNESFRERLESPELGTESPEPSTSELPERPAPKHQKRKPAKRKARASDGPPPRIRQQEERRRHTIQPVQQRIRESESPSAQLEQEERDSARTLEGCKQSFLHLKRILGRKAWTNGGSDWMEAVDSDSPEWREAQLETLTMAETEDFAKKAWVFGDACRSHSLATFLSKLQRSMTQLTKSMQNIQDCRVRYMDPQFRVRDNQKQLSKEVRRVAIPLLFRELTKVLYMGIEAESGTPGMSVTFAGIIRSVLKRVMELDFEDIGPEDGTDENRANQRASQLEGDRKAFFRHVDYVIDRLDSLVDGHNAACAVRDAVIRQARAEAEAQRKREQDLRIEEFFSSTQKQSEAPSARGKGKQAEWRYSEDEILLGMIRATRRPDLEVVASMLRGRNATEVRERIGQLRRTFRRVFARSDLEPPQWCYEAEE